MDNYQVKRGTLQKLLGKQAIYTGLDDLLDRIQPFGHAEIYISSNWT